MTRKKLNLAYIVNDPMRKATYYKRKRGFVKKVHELSVLCGIDACAVIYSPYSPIPEVWPSKSGVKNVVDKFEILTEMDKRKKMVNHEGFLRQNIAKNMESNDKKMKDNMERTMKEVMFHFLGGKGDNLKLTDRNYEDLCKYIDQYLKELYHHMNVTLNQSGLESGESSEAGDVIAPVDIAQVGSSDVFNSHQQENELWALRPIFSSGHRTEQVNTYGISFVPTTNEQQGCYHPTIDPPVGVYDQLPNLDHNENQQKEYLIDHMMNPTEQMDFLKMDDKDRYYNH